MVYVPIENKLRFTENAMSDLLTDFSHMVGEVEKEDELIMQQILDKTYEAYVLLEELNMKIK